MGNTKIEWAESTWNPVTGCSKISDGCRNCYAERMAKRLAGRYGYPMDEPFRPTFHPERLSEPLKWKKPRRVFVCSMGDLFHSDVDDRNIAAVFLRIASLPIHKFLVLTKRPERMKEFFFTYKFPSGKSLTETILPNLWIGVTVENDQERHRIDTLRSIPAAVRFISFEPLLSGIGNIRLQGISWAIIGCESGPKRRHCRPELAENLVTQCHDAGVPVFVKQADVAGKLVKMPEILGKVWNEYPK